MAGETTTRRGSLSIAVAAAVLALALVSRPAAQSEPAVGAGRATTAQQVDALFQPAGACMVCHDGIVAPSGEDVSFGAAWRASIMAHSARDPYWHAGVRREVMDHPVAQAAIEQECSRCHMPMAHVRAAAAGETPAVFANLPGQPTADPLALEGVSCAVCHQITADGLGERSSFTGHFTIDLDAPIETRPMFGPYTVDRGRTAVMRSASGFVPTEAAHVQTSELCATCHTLYTTPLDEHGRAIGEFPEQVPYQEWLASDYRTTRTCQSCHMPVVDRPTRIASVVGESRANVSRHTFIGGNFFMLGVLNRFRADLGVTAAPGELDRAIASTKELLRTETARVDIAGASRDQGRVAFEVAVTNLAGHKLPTAYPSRRAWLFVTVRNATGDVVFSSGAPQPNGAIAGNDNDEDPRRFEPHYREISAADQVQIYEPIMATRDGDVTTGLLSAVRYLKDNRVPPKGFDKRVVPPDVAVRGDALDDPDFVGGSDVVRYSVDVSGAEGPFTVDAELWYQPIGFRWAQNLRSYDAAEPQRFIRYYEQMAGASAERLARAVAVTVD